MQLGISFFLAAESKEKRKTKVFYSHSIPLQIWPFRVFSLWTAVIFLFYNRPWESFIPRRPNSWQHGRIFLKYLVKPPAAPTRDSRHVFQRKTWLCLWEDWGRRWRIAAVCPIRVEPHAWAVQPCRPRPDAFSLYDVSLNAKTHPPLKRNTMTISIWKQACLKTEMKFTRLQDSVCPTILPPRLSFCSTRLMLSKDLTRITKTRVRLCFRRLWLPYKRHVSASRRSFISRLDGRMP